jgi:Na+-driven multidrug efflux pump
MGVVGAALSTVLSQLCAALLCYVYIRLKLPKFRISADILKPERAVMAECLKIGIPMAVTNFVVMFGGIILSFVTNGIGMEYVAAYTCASRVGYIVTTPIFGFATALAVFTAQNMGSGNLPRIKEGIKKTFAAVTGVNILLFVAFWFAAEPLMSFMLNGETVAVGAAKTYLLTRCGAMFTLTFAAGYKNVLNSMGRTAFPTLSGFIEIGVRYLIPLTLSGVLGFICVPLTDAVSWTVLAVFLAIAYFIEIRKIERNGLKNEE